MQLVLGILTIYHYLAICVIFLTYTAIMNFELEKVVYVLSLIFY